MSKYLERYIGTYRVKAHYDLDTKDYPRDMVGNIDPSFDDYYIDCYNNIEIRHSDRDVLACYIPNVNRGKNILRCIYGNYVGKTTPPKVEKICDELLKYNILTDITITDGEVYFCFKATMIEYIAKLVRAKTSGAGIRPLSTKNLPRTPYVIPDKDMRLYKKAIDGKDPLVVGRIGQQWAKNHPEYKAAMKKNGLNIKQYAHKMGDWEAFCEFVANTI